MNEEGDQFNPSVAMLADGGFAIGYHQEPLSERNFEVMARRFDATGEPQSDEFQMNTHIEANQRNVRLSAGPSGFFAVWQSYYQDEYGWGVFGRSYDGTFGIDSAEFMLSETGNNDETSPAVASGGDGRIVVVWHQDDGFNFKIRTRVIMPADGH